MTNFLERQMNLKSEVTFGLLTALADQISRGWP